MIRIDIVNDGTGTTEVGHYDAYLYLPEGEHKVRVENFDRSQGWKALAQLAIERLEEYVSEVERTVADAQGEHPRMERLGPSADPNEVLELWEAGELFVASDDVGR